jgi:hypothetical protein
VSQFGTIQKKHPFIKNNTPSDEVTRSLHSIAKERHIMLVNLLEMSQGEFENSECSREKWTIAEALGVSSSNLPTKGTNEYDTIVRVRELVRSKLDLGGKNLWLNICGDDLIIKLLQRKMACVWCYRTGLRHSLDYLMTPTLLS